MILPLFAAATSNSVCNFVAQELQCECWCEIAQPHIRHTRGGLGAEATEGVTFIFLACLRRYPVKRVAGVCVLAVLEFAQRVRVIHSATGASIRDHIPADSDNC